MENYVEYLVFALIAVGVFFAVVRMIRGPKTADRIVALDTLNIMIVGIISLLAYLFENGMYLDIAIAYAILAFLETMVFARYMEGKLWK
jgi:multicomponent Na+:H+ antiporter subunit F